tara:strand:- start:9130 stop:9297 length:168 start_codon:yes stop_codon:yes gene_type:complete
MAKEIILEPNWERLWAWFMQVKKEDEITFLRMVEKMGGEWHKFKNMAKKKGWPMK